VPGYDVATWWGVLAPGRTPAPVVSRLNDEIRKAMASEDATSVILANGAVPELAMTPDQFNAMLRTETATWRRIVQERSIKGE
jgi:tripartite-type tricarboxylate transporter receptor subunit TctC